ncbi:hypothetical protein MPF90_04500 [Helicobacter pylori]|nr:hypothetical protein [Helicobacter pylori]UOR68698.1 hypothetical protein MPF90_04500 [Helicobacter pylori]
MRLTLSRRHRHDEKTQLQSLSLQPRRKRLALRCGFNPHDFERFFEIPIIDKDQKLQEKAQRALEIMVGQTDSLESGHYDVKMIQSRQKDLENL